MCHANVSRVKMGGALGHAPFCSSSIFSQVLESIMWPWSDAQDERAYKAEIDELAKITGALYLALTLIGERLSIGVR